MQCQLCPKIIKPARLGEFRQHLKKLHHNDLPALKNKPGSKVKYNEEDKAIIARFPDGKVSCVSKYYKLILILFSASSVRQDSRLPKFGSSDSISRGNIMRGRNVSIVHGQAAHM